MQRTVLLLRPAAAGFLACTLPLRNSPTTPETPVDYAKQRKEAENFAKNFKTHTMTVHERSSYEYKGSTKGAEVGARNEAAFMNYEEFQPRTLNQRLVMPGTINLLTVSPLYCALLCIASAAWGVFYWDMYVRKNYETVLIARPKGL